MGLLDEFSNFAQGASNSAASNVTAPVDGIAWLLRKAGLGNVIGNAPVGGSDWAANQGLTKPANGIGGLLGESAGAVLPMLAAAKAPQIASTINQGISNYTNTAPMFAGPGNAQRGATVWHGSPHSFDAFDASKIGTGEGAQAYGHGLYLAESPAVAGSYQKALSSGKVTAPTPANSAEQSILEVAQYRAQQIGGDLAQGLQNMERNTADPTRLAAIRGLIDRTQKDGGALYKVDLPDEHIAKMLNYDKPLHRQAPEVRNAVRSIVDGEQGAGTYQSWIRSRPDFRDLQGNMLDSMSNEQISEKMRQAGIPGIRYLDGGSRGAGAGSSNYVVFPGNEGLLSILERNGQPLK